MLTFYLFARTTRAEGVEGVEVMLHLLSFARDRRNEKKECCIFASSGFS